MLKALDDKALNTDFASTLTYTLVNARKRRSTHPLAPQSRSISLPFRARALYVPSLVTALSWICNSI